jgi:RNA polymerase sigma-70 factor (ECF subfamily)
MAKAEEQATLSPAERDEAIRQAQRGDSSAFATLYRAYVRRIYGVCYHLLGKPADAEDAASEVFLKMQSGLATYSPSQPFEGWLYRVAVNHCVDWLRRRKGERMVFADTDAAEAMARDDAPSALADLVTDEEIEVVRRVLQEMPARLRIPLVMRFYNEMSYDEIARTLSMNRRTVGVMIFRAKRELARRLRARPSHARPEASGLRAGADLKKKAAT